MDNLKHKASSLVCMTSGGTHTTTHLTALSPGLPRWAGTRNVKPIWILLKHETVSGSGISWDMCKSAPHSRQITTPAPHRSVLYRPDALPAAQPTTSTHWRQILRNSLRNSCRLIFVDLIKFVRDLYWCIIYCGRCWHLLWRLLYACDRFEQHRLDGVAPD